jgi:hypothetical protein
MGNSIKTEVVMKKQLFIFALMSFISLGIIHSSYQAKITKKESAAVDARKNTISNKSTKTDSTSHSCLTVKKNKLKTTGSRAPY